MFINPCEETWKHMVRSESGLRRSAKKWMFDKHLTNMEVFAQAEAYTHICTRTHTHTHTHAHTRTHTHTRTHLCLLGFCQKLNVIYSPESHSGKGGMTSDNCVSTHTLFWAGNKASNTLTSYYFSFLFSPFCVFCASKAELEQPLNNKRNKAI